MSEKSYQDEKIKFDSHVKVKTISSPQYSEDIIFII